MDVYGILKFGGFCAIALFAIYGRKQSRDQLRLQFNRRPTAFTLGYAGAFVVFGFGLYLAAYPGVVPPELRIALLVLVGILVVGLFVWARNRGKQMSELQDRARARDRLLAPEAHTTFIDPRDQK